MSDPMTILASRMRALDRGGHRQPAPVMLMPSPPSLSSPTADRILLRPHEAAALVGVHEKTLAKWPVPRFVFNGVVGYRPMDLEKFVAEHVAGQSSPVELHAASPAAP